MSQKAWTQKQRAGCETKRDHKKNQLTRVIKHKRQLWVARPTKTAPQVQECGAVTSVKI
ncbi:MAG: hypothetical protein ACJAYH_000684 [Celeribacter sp.]|jgi:hypothetical protein